MKECPRCHALMFEDMDVCYECLYNFKLENVADTNIPPSLDDLEEAERPQVVTSHSVTIGRAKSNDVVIAEPNVSRKHAKVVFSSAGIFLEDLASTNGVRLNGKRFRGTGRVKEGDVIGVGNAALKVLRESVALMS